MSAGYGRESNGEGRTVVAHGGELADAVAEGVSGAQRGGCVIAEGGRAEGEGEGEGEQSSGEEHGCVEGSAGGRGGDGCCCWSGGV